jgi:hypothetical protein
LKQLSFADYVAVVGSGLSHDIAVDLDKLIATMERVSGIPRAKGESGQDEPQWLFFDRIYNWNARAYYEMLKESFGTTRPFEGLAYKQIVRIRFKSFVTLNFDDLLPRAFADLNSGHSKADCPFTVYNGKDAIFLPSDFSVSRQCLVAVHGCKNKAVDWNERLILRWKDYTDHYCGDGKAQQTFLYMWWYWLLTTCPCIFIGTSLREPGLDVVIRDILQRSRDSFERQRHIHLVAVDRRPEPPFYPEQCQQPHEGIANVLYDKIDQDHRGLVDVLSHVLGASETSPSVIKLPRSQMRTEFTIGTQAPDKP